ncbi:MAG: hypothetical protein ABIS86_23645 [Streptosporangiaceae bacterium]
MRVRAVLLLTASATTVALTGVSADAAPTPHWRASATPAPVRPGALNQIAISDPKLAWAAGIEGGGTALWRWNGTKWLRTRAARPFTPIALAVSDAKHAWAAGIDTRGSQAAFWNGRKWTKVGYFGIPVEISAGRDGAAFSVSGDLFGGRTRLLGWSRNAWRTVRVPLPAAATLASVAVRSRKDVWISGSYQAGKTTRSLLRHWNGKKWRNFAFPVAATRNGNVIHRIIAVSPKQVWALRGTSPSTLLKWNGKKWGARRLPGNTGSLTLTSDGRGGVWVLPYSPSSDTRTTYLHWSGGRWTRLSGPVRKGNPGLGDLELIPGTTRVVSVGGLQQTPQGRPKIPFLETYH